MSNDNQVRVDLIADPSGIKPGTDAAARDLDSFKKDTQDSAAELGKAWKGASEVVTKEAAQMAGASERVAGAFSRMAFRLGPVGLGVLAVGAAWFQGQREAQAYANALILTGNAAGSTTGQMREYARAIADATDATQAAAAGSMTALAASGRMTADVMRDAAAAAILLAEAGGPAVAETVRRFTELGRAPVDASVKLNDQYHYLTAAIFEQIKALEDQGRAEDAAALAQTTFATAMEERARQMQENIGWIEAAWKSAGDVAKRAWDNMLNIGRTSDLDRLRSQLDFAVASGASDAEIASIEALLAPLEEIERKNRGVAEQKAKQSEQDAAGIQWAQEADKFITRRERMEREIAKARELGLQAGRSELEIEQRIAAIREKYRNKSGQKTSDLDRMLARGEQNLIADFYKYAGDDDAATFSEEAMRKADARSLALAKKQEEASRKAWEDYERTAARAAERAADKQAREFQRSADDINRALTDAIMDGGQSGGDLLQRYFANLILRPVISAVMDPVAKEWAGIASNATSGIGDWLREAMSPGFGDIAGQAAGVPAYALGTPYVPNDGLAYLHQGERVLTREENAAWGSGGGMVINVIESSERAGQIRQGAGRDGNRELTIWIAQFKSEIKNEIAGDISDGRGAIPAAMTNSYGLNRAPGSY